MIDKFILTACQFIKCYFMLCQIKESCSYLHFLNSCLRAFFCTWCTQEYFLKSIWPIEGTTMSQSGRESNNNEGNFVPYRFPGLEPNHQMQEIQLAYSKPCWQSKMIFWNIETELQIWTMGISTVSTRPNKRSIKQFLLAQKNWRFRYLIYPRSKLASSKQAHTSHLKWFIQSQ